MTGGLGGAIAVCGCGARWGTGGGAVGAGVNVVGGGPGAGGAPYTDGACWCAPYAGALEPYAPWCLGDVVWYGDPREDGAPYAGAGVGDATAAGVAGAGDLVLVVLETPLRMILFRKTVSSSLGLPGTIPK